jgi:A/G-specific adenine glycosylase
MPWRRTRDPYAVWVSEVMLQQTQVATATPFYHSFLERFPTLEALSRARPADVLHAWAGLGYYRRARSLHQAAGIVVREHGGRVPDDPGAFGQLPGVGRYTAGAVLSIAFDRPLAVLDGNVARVLSRLFALRASVRDARGARRLWALAERLVPRRAPGDWNQAVMELGAVICTPRAPRCPECPVAGLCRARELERVEAYPPAVARRAVERRRVAVALIERGGRMLVACRPGPLLAGLWEPPSVELRAGERAGPPLARVLAALGIEARLSPTNHVVRHAITHRAIAAEVWRGEPVRAPRSAAVRFVDPARPQVALTALANKLARLRGAL